VKLNLNPKVLAVWKWLVYFFKKVFIVLGVITFLAIIFSFTDYPFWAYYWLGTHNSELESPPDIVVLMGGGGMPSPDGLIRCYYAAEIAHIYPRSRVIIAIPADTAQKEYSPELLMGEELKMRGIDSVRILYEKEGFNTRTQALNIFNMLGKVAADSLALRIVTSPEHMFRSVATFRKIGFSEVGGAPSFEEDIEESLLVEKKKIYQADKQNTRGLNIRYNMWNYLKYEITVLREYCAIVYYKLKGWI